MHFLSKFFSGEFAVVEVTFHYAYGSLQEGFVHGIEAYLLRIDFHRFADLVLETVLSVLRKIISHEGDVPGAKREECGNYRNLSLDAAKRECEKYLAVLLSKVNDFEYKGAEAKK